MICTRSKSLYPELLTALGKYVYTGLPEKKKYLDFTGSNLTVLMGYEMSHIKWDYPVNLPGQSKGQKIVESKLQDITKLKNYMFFKNGHNAVDCAIRLARNNIEDECAEIYFYGYHGTGSEYVSTINRNGIMVGTSDWNTQIKSIDELPEAEQIDILVYESRFQEEADKINAKFKICDHLKSGYFGLFEKTADLDCYGKSIANGYPVSVLAGNEHMERLPEIYYSTTFGGDNLGLLAIDYVLAKAPEYYREWKVLGEYMFKKINCEPTGFYQGIPYSFKCDSITPEKIKLALDKELIIGQWMTLFPQHTPEDIDRLKEFCN